MMKARTRGKAVAVAAVAGLAAVLLFAPAYAEQASLQDWQSAIPADHGDATARLVNLRSGQEPGSILISTEKFTLDYVVDSTHVRRYKVGVGRDGFRWTGAVRIGHKAEWPDWRPPREMRARQPDLPEVVPAGPFNPLGARAIYLFKDGRDTLYRIHGTNDASTNNGFVSSGCFRMTNADVMDLYERVRIGSKVVVE